MTVRQFLSAAIAGASLIAASGAASAQPKASLCSADFVLSDVLGAHASADIKDGGLERLYVEMGPARAAAQTKGVSVSGAYDAQTSDVMIWNYMSIYQPAAKWLEPGSVRLEYSGFRIRWPEFRSAGKAVKALKLTVTQGAQSMTVDVASATDQVFAIDFEAMLAGRFPAMRVDDHAAWRRAAEAGHHLSVTLTDAANGKIVAQADVPRLDSEVLQPLLSGGLNALRDKFKAGGCS